MAKLAAADAAAVEIAFYLALSIVPLVGVAIALVGHWMPVDLSPNIEAVLRGVLPVASQGGAGEILRWARSSSSHGWLTIGFLMALWTSFRFTSHCIRSLDRVVGARPHRSRSTLRLVLTSLLLLTAWIAAFVATALFALLAPAIEAVLLRLPAISAPSLLAFAILQPLLVAGILFSAIFLTYRAVVGGGPVRLRVALAAFLASLGWIGATRAFAAAVPILWKATRLYGTLGCLVLFLIWSDLMAWILLLGGLLLSCSKRARASGDDG